MELEEILSSLILDNAIHNAIKHGANRDACVRLSVSVSDAELPQAPTTPTAPTGGYVQVHPSLTHETLALVCTVTNQANPKKPVITNDYVQGIIRGFRNQDTPALSDQIGYPYYPTREMYRAKPVDWKFISGDQWCNGIAVLVISGCGSDFLALSVIF